MRPLTVYAVWGKDHHNEQSNKGDCHAAAGHFGSFALFFSILLLVLAFRLRVCAPGWNTDRWARCSEA
jgi:hypothetical protein